MRRLFLIPFLAFPLMARAQCVPTQATPGMMGCEPITSAVLSTDYIQVWIPGTFPASAQLISTTNLFSGRTLTNPVISGGTIDSAVIGGTTPAAGHFTTLGATGVLTLSAQPVFASSVTGVGTQTFTNSPCSGLTTAKWIPVTITGQSGTWNVPACQ